MAPFHTSCATSCQCDSATVSIALSCRPTIFEIFDVKPCCRW